MLTFVLTGFFDSDLSYQLLNSTMYVAIYSIYYAMNLCIGGCEISFNKIWRSPTPSMEFAVYYLFTEELETVIFNLALRDELKRQQLCSVPKKYEFLGLRSENRLFFGKKVPKMV